ncbi:MAG: DNA cytosine methyltransferase [Akkermansiaceae bacterium]|nr:DNA cytosine methyltransferase [Akkermansiaceae bacterium]
MTSLAKTVQKNYLKPIFVDFFAGSGLVTQGAKHACAPVWSNDICPKKAASYTANHGDHFHP